MMSILCLSATWINTIVTSISIVCTLVSLCAACKAKRIKESLQLKYNIFELDRYVHDLGEFIKRFKSLVRKNGWNKGKTVCPEIKAMDCLLVDWNKVRVLIKGESEERSIADVFNSINSFGDYTAWDYEISKSVIDKFLEVDKFLNVIIDRKKQSL